MNIRDQTVLILGGAGLVGQAVARIVLAHGPARLVIGSLRRSEAEEGVRAVAKLAHAHGTELSAVWGDVFVPRAMKDRPRAEILADPDALARLIDDLYGELTEEVFQRSALGALLVDVRPQVIVDCINTAGALAYQDVFASAARLRHAATEGSAGVDAVDRHLSTLYLPQIIRHTQIALEGMKRAETQVFVKVGTVGTGGMGLNIPFTHSEERPSRVLLAKSGIAGAQTLFLYLMARTPGAPAVKEVKPTAAISWKSIGSGPVRRGGRPIPRFDAVRPLALAEAFSDAAEGAYRDLGEPLEGVYIDAGENGVFTVAEFETLTALGLMEFVTPEEIAENVVREILSHPTGRDVVTALDAATMGPTYRAGVLRSVAIDHMEALEARAGTPSVAYEMLGPPRLSKLLFEGEILRRIHGRLEAAAGLDPEATAAAAVALVEEDDDLRQRIVSIGLPILLADGERLLRGPEVKARDEGARSGLDERLVERGWVDLRATNWERWRSRCADVVREIGERPGVDEGSTGDHEYGDLTGAVRPGRLAAWIFRYEDRGERIKR